MCLPVWNVFTLTCHLASEKVFSSTSLQQIRLHSFWFQTGILLMKTGKQERSNHRNHICECILVYWSTDVFPYTHGLVHTAAQLIKAHYKQPHGYGPVHVHMRWHTQPLVADPNPGTHTFPMSHNCFQSKGSCLSGPDAAWLHDTGYKILRREGRAAGERQREWCACTFFTLPFCPSFHVVPGVC